MNKRFWRIYPELWVAVAVEIVVLLLLYHQPIDWPQMGLFVFGQATIFQFWTPDFLRGYGCGTPNGALWTICVIIQFYFVVYYLHKMLHGRNLKIWLLCLILSVGVSMLTPLVKDVLGEIFGKIYGVTLIPFLWMFLSAAFVSEFKERYLLFLKEIGWFLY